MGYYSVQELLKLSVMFSDDLNYSQAIFNEPPKTIKNSDYICSKTFYLDPIRSHVRILIYWEWSIVDRHSSKST